VLPNVTILFWTNILNFEKKKIMQPFFSRLKKDCDVNFFYGHKNRKKQKFVGKLQNGHL
jgi:hypothetical protein